MPLIERGCFVPEPEVKFIVEFGAKEVRIGRFGMTTERKSIVRVNGEYNIAKGELIRAVLDEIDKKLRAKGGE